MKQHKHAAVIHAWADGAEIEYRGKDGDQWMRAGIPEWADHTQYRVKPERVYPVTRMALNELNNVWGRAPTNEEAHALRYVANAALRHAIDAGQLVEPQYAIEELDIPKWNEMRKVRDLAIARAVEEVYIKLVPNKTANSDYYLECIIATVKD